MAFFTPKFSLNKKFPIQWIPKKQQETANQINQQKKRKYKKKIE